MLSTGNDIVSLKGINVTRTLQPNFYSKILAPSETALHSEPRFAAIPFEVFVWLLWSIKESAFKFLQRINPDVIFTPVKFEVKEFYMPEGFKLIDFDLTELTAIGFDDFEAISATVHFENNICYSKSLVYKNLVSTVVSINKNCSETHWGIKQIDNYDMEIQSSKVRAFAINGLQIVLNDNMVTITKNKHQIPVAIQNQAKAIPISLSHHENWVAYSFILQ
jgi:phosphopantetheinyl transferase (holo-ACP synthase)